MKVEEEEEEEEEEEGAALSFEYISKNLVVRARELWTEMMIASSPTAPTPHPTRWCCSSE